MGHGPGELAIHHMLNPAVAGRQQMLIHQRLNTLLIRTKFLCWLSCPASLLEASGLAEGSARTRSARSINVANKGPEALP